MHRAFWLRQLHTWHWISAALSLSGMLLFSVTGLTLNHAGKLPARISTIDRHVALPAALHARLAQWPQDTEDAVPAELGAWIRTTFSLEVRHRPTQTDAQEIHIDLPAPGADGWLRIDRDSGEVHWHQVKRGWIAYLNDLHKGRYTGTAWSWFIDLLAISAIVFTLTGLALLGLHGRQRPATWPVTGLGLLLPLLAALLFMHR